VTASSGLILLLGSFPLKKSELDDTRDMGGTPSPSPQCEDDKGTHEHEGYKCANGDSC
jgi:hypothetical protein